MVLISLSFTVFYARNMHVALLSHTAVEHLSSQGCGVKRGDHNSPFTALLLPGRTVAKWADILNVKYGELKHNEKICLLVFHALNICVQNVLHDS